jgi:hypothetical protein
VGYGADHLILPFMKEHCIMRTSLVSIALVAATTALATAAQGADLVVMPTGDSLTAGYPGVGGHDPTQPPCTVGCGDANQTTPFGGYRQLLFDMLLDAGLSPAFTGRNYFFLDNPDKEDWFTWGDDPAYKGNRRYEQKAGPLGMLELVNDSYASGLQPNPECGGNGCVERVARDVRDLQPDIILYLHGINDWVGGASYEEIEAALRATIAKMFEARPCVWVLVGNYPGAQAMNHEPTLRINESLARMPAAFPGKKIAFVDMTVGVVPADLKDDVHPVRSGYTKMAEGWLRAMDQTYTTLCSGDISAIYSRPSTGTGGNTASEGGATGAAGHSTTGGSANAAGTTGTSEDMGASSSSDSGGCRYAPAPPVGYSPLIALLGAALLRFRRRRAHAEK